MNTCLQNCRPGDWIICRYNNVYVVAHGYDPVHQEVVVNDLRGKNAGFFQLHQINLIARIVKKPSPND